LDSPTKEEEIAIQKFCDPLTLFPTPSLLGVVVVNGHPMCSMSSGRWQPVAQLLQLPYRIASPSFLKFRQLIQGCLNRYDRSS